MKILLFIFISMSLIGIGGKIYLLEKCGNLTPNQCDFEEKSKETK